MSDRVDLLVDLLDAEGDEAAFTVLRAGESSRRRPGNSGRIADLERLAGIPIAQSVPGESLRAGW